MARFAGFIFKLITLVLMALWSPLFALAQAPDGDVIINYVEATVLDSGEVRVSAFVSVTNPEGQPYTRLTTAEFSVFENNTPVEKSALNVTLSTAPMTITLLIDTSSSMAQPGPAGVRAIDAVKDAAIAFIDALGEKDQVAIYAYDAQARRQQDFTYDHNLAIDQGIVKLDATEAKASCLYDALLTTLEDALAKPGERIIVVVTGNPNGPVGEPCSSTTSDDVLQAATTVGNSVPIFSVGFGEAVNQEELTGLSQRSGGRSLLASDSTTLANLLTLLLEQLKNRYEISYVTQAPSGPARLTITENSSQGTDRRQVLIPVAIQPTPTPLPQFAIDLSVDQKLDEGKLEVKVNVPAEVSLTKAELFINNKLDQQKIAPPFDRFELNLAQLGSGKHGIRVEATDKNGVTASAEVELTLSLLPTPIPTIPPTPTSPTVAPTPAGSGLSGSIPFISLALILAGLLLLILLVGLIAYVLFVYAKRPAVTPPPVSPPPPPQPVIKTSLAPEPPEVQPPPSLQPLPADPRELVARRAKLVVLDGQQVVEQNVFGLQKLETKIGRNTPQETVNDIPIKDKEVSRAHAKIVYHDRQFFIQDLKSSTGTKVNGMKLTPFQEIALQNGAEVAIGPRVKFKFEFFVPRSINETLDDSFDQGDSRSKDEDDDPNRTLYDF